MKPLESISRPQPLHKTAQEAIRQYIVENHLAANDPLPGEMELARQLGIGRNSVREAIKALESLGIVDVRRGQGVFVKAFSFEPLLDGLSYGLLFELREVDELLDIRRALEAGMISQAMASISEHDLAELRNVVTSMKDQASQGKPFMDLDKQFHTLLFSGLGNVTLLRLLDVFWIAFQQASQHVNISDETPEITADHHARILDAVAANDEAGTREALDEHYEGIRQRLARAQRQVQDNANSSSA